MHITTMLHVYKVYIFRRKITFKKKIYLINGSNCVTKNWEIFDACIIKCHCTLNKRLIVTNLQQLAITISRLSTITFQDYSLGNGKSPVGIHKQLQEDSSSKKRVSEREKERERDSWTAILSQLRHVLVTAL